jgi:hypothetical protein
LVLAVLLPPAHLEIMGAHPYLVQFPQLAEAGALKIILHQYRAVLGVAEEEIMLQQGRKAFLVKVMLAVLEFKVAVLVVAAVAAVRVLLVYLPLLEEQAMAVRVLHHLSMEL